MTHLSTKILLRNSIYKVKFLVFNDLSVFQKIGYFILHSPRTPIKKNTLNGPDFISPAQTWSSFTA